MTQHQPLLTVLRQSADPAVVDAMERAIQEAPDS